MSAKAAGPGAWITEDKTASGGLEINQEQIEAFNLKYGPAVDDIYQQLMKLVDPVEFHMLGRALVAVVGVAANERVKKLDSAE